MSSEDGKKDQLTPRRGLLRFGTLVTAFTGASAMSAMSAHAAPGGDKTAYVPTAEKGAPLGVAALDIESHVPATQLPDLTPIIARQAVPVVDSPLGPMGVRRKVSSTHGTGYVFGTANSFGFAGTGNPPEIAGPFGIYQEYGRSNPGAGIPKTTQGGYAVTNYWGPTTDDVAEGLSSAVLLKDGGVPYTQTASTTGLEGITQVESGVTVSGKTVAVSGRAGFKGTSRTAYSYAFLAHTEKDASATVDSFIAYGQPQPGPAVYNFGVKVVDRIETQTSMGVTPANGNGIFNVSVSGVTVSAGSTPFARFQPPSTSDFVSLRVGAAAGQTKNIQEWWPAAATAAQAYVDIAGGVRSRQGVFAHDAGGAVMVGLTSLGPKWYSTSLQQVTVGASGTAAPLPPQPNKYLRIVDPSGAVLVIPAYNS
jgi:hypothetical protein